METLCDVNGSITLANTTVKLKDGPSSSAQVMLRLAPTPCIFFHLLNSSQEFNIALLDACTKDAGDIAIELPSGQEIQLLNTVGGLIPCREPLTVLETGKPAREIQFGVINFPDFLEPRRPADESLRNMEDLDIWTIHLKDGTWSVELRPVDGREYVHKSLNVKRGFALTHMGKVTRLDGKVFPIETVRPFMKALGQFLSFARGVFCGMTLVKGLDEAGETVWEEWGTTKVQPWNGDRSCLDTHYRATLEDLFTGFMRYYNEQPTANSNARAALELYLDSNAQDASHTSIVLTQPVLERLTFEKVGKRKEKVGNWIARALRTFEKVSKRKEKEKVGEWIARALRKVNVDPGIPQSLREVLGNRKSFAHGPHVLVAIRDDFAHPEMREWDSKVYWHAKQLGLWYAELLLLERFGYRGVYSNRLTRERRGEVETVPWASHV